MGAEGTAEGAAREPRVELAQLGHALERHLRRRSEARQRRVPGLPRAALATPAPAPLLGSGDSQARPAAQAATRLAPAPKAQLGARPALSPRPSAAPAPAASAAFAQGSGATPETQRAAAAACPDVSSLRAAVARCRACSLCETRTQTVFGDGEGSSGLLFVGEAPGQNEDLQGLPFVGDAGRLLNDIITKGMGLSRAQVSIANVLKCRPPGNRDPSPAEKALCSPWLERQIELLDPKVIVPLGLHAAQQLLASEAPLGRLRQQVHRRGSRAIVPTYHPAYLLRTPSAKKDCWQDIQLALRELGLPLPPRQGAG